MSEFRHFRQVGRSQSRTVGKGMVAQFGDIGHCYIVRGCNLSAAVEAVVGNLGDKAWKNRFLQGATRKEVIAQGIDVECAPPVVGGSCRHGDGRGRTGANLIDSRRLAVGAGTGGEGSHCESVVVVGGEVVASSCDVATLELSSAI